ncbi:hypothetical protein GCM10010436_76640 [Paractinoplanes durhamensis]
MDSAAYGQLCQFLPGLLSPVFTGAAEVMADAVEALSETALKLRATAGGMDAADLGSAGRVTDAGGSGPVLPL